PDVLEDIKGRRRVTWILLSQNAQVVDVRDGVLTLGLANQGVRENFVRGTHAELLRESLQQVIGVTLQVNPIVDANAADAPVQQRPPAEPAPAPVQQRSAAAQEARDELRRSRTGQSAASPPEPEPEPSRDDVSLEDEVSGDELLMKHLGAELIDDSES
ncbi:MAG: hypothetical protein AAGC63_07305, partial [Propionicimonas sp.]|nr:hypothetical protein [Propionicimonas sp.]